MNVQWEEPKWRTSTKNTESFKTRKRISSGNDNRRDCGQRLMKEEKIERIQL
jgi:hypothetical protein